MPNKEASLRIPETLRKVNHIIGIFSAKGGVGKSEISLNLALSLKDKGYSVGLVDADIYGPSQPLLLGASSEEIEVKDKELLSPLIKDNIKFMSMGLIASERMPVIWRGPMVSGAVMQLLSQTDWQELDYLIVDTPPGTGDVQLTLLQRMPLSATIVVTTPQKVSVSDTRKGIEMINKLKIPILGLVENMSYFNPSNSTDKYYIFGKGGGEELAKEYGLDLFCQIPLTEKEESLHLYYENGYKKIFDNLSDKAIGKLNSLSKEINQTIPQVPSSE
tara:strand:- start:1287 stop:2111 length:825 start_codon:yes stop_codon:yes gene_type:complete